MKKFVLSVALMVSVFAVKAQLYLNELYVRPSDGNDEFFELYNRSLTPVNAGCYTLVTYFNENGQKGFYVIDIPDFTVAPHGFLVGASRDPYINYQNGQAEADFSWNANNTTKYVYQNGKFVAQPAADYNNIFIKSGETDKSKNGLYAVFLFNGSTVVDVFLGSESKGKVPAYITEMGVLTHTSNGSACGNLTYDFKNINSDQRIIGEVAQVPSNAGTDNGYLRSGNGPCPDNDNWYKASNPAQHTPGAPNPIRNENRGNGQGNKRDSLTVFAACANAATFQYNITGQSQDVYPLTVTLYHDVNGNAQLDEEDVQIGQNANYAFKAGMQAFPRQSGQEFYILMIDAQGSCYDEVIPVQCEAGIILPVSLSRFDARRNGRGGVALTWETVSEQNNKGFYIERNTGRGWETVTFIPSQAEGGNSNSLLAYTYSDANSAAGVSQYRLHQVDVDGKGKYSEIRSIRGEAQNGKTVVYPNPSSNGAVNVLFDEANGGRDVFVSDMSGKIIRQWKGYAAGSLQIDNLSSGMYTIRIIDVQRGTQSSQKLVVNNR